MSGGSSGEYSIITCRISDFLYHLFLLIINRLFNQIGGGTSSGSSSSGGQSGSGEIKDFELLFYFL